MAKKIIQDIYIVKKSIRMIKKSDVRDGFFSDIKRPVPIEVKTVGNDLLNKFPIADNTVDVDDTDNFEYIEEKKHVTKDSLMLLWVICIVSIATLLFLLSSVFATATLNITPKNQVLALNDTYNITSDKTVSTSTLHFEVMSITKDMSKNLETDGEEYVQNKAMGKVILYNNFSTSNQRLIINTRLESKEGLIYKTVRSVVIPGIKTINGVKTPGSVEVGIAADDVGDKYNMKLTDLKGDFTIYGFKGTPKYTAFYGRLSADLVGGFVGNLKKVSDEKLAAGRKDLTDNLKTELIKEIYSKVPDQYILFNNNYYVQCNDLDDSTVNKEYTITEKCSLNAVVFNKDMLASFIAGNKINSFDNSKVDIMWNDNDSVSLQGVTEKPWNETSIKATFTGPAQIIWTYNAADILSSIAGQDKNIINSIIQNNKNSLTEIQATIRPMWRNTFPENTQKIKIVDTIRDGVK